MRRTAPILALLAACAATATAPAPLDLQGHRGARGHLPENTIPSFLLALDQGATTLELDVVVSADRQVVVSHEPWFEADISSLPSGEPVSEATEATHNLFALTYEEIARYDVGRRGNHRFPDQRPLPAHKPRLGEVFALADAHAAERGDPPPRYNVEIKSREAWDGVYTPPVEEFAALVVEAIGRAGVGPRSTVQSFDERALRALEDRPHGVELALLVGKSEDRGLDGNLELLGFAPEIYSPNHELVDAALVAACRARGLRLVPWTVNERARMVELVALGVDGIITDYPDRARGLGGR